MSRILILALTLALSPRSFCQDADVIYTNYEKTIFIQKTNGEPTAVSHYNIEMKMLTDKASNMLSRYYVFHSGYNELKDLEAYTKIPVNNKYKILKVQDIKTGSSSQSNVFYDDSRESVFDFPGLTQNAVAHVEYKLLHKEARLLSPFFVPDHIPVKEAIFSVVVPEGIEIRHIVKNDPLKKLRFTEEKKGRETIYRWTINDTEKTAHFSDAPDFRHYAPHVIIHITSYQTKNGNVNYLNSLEDLYKWNVAFTKELNKNNVPALSMLVDSLVSGIPDPLEKTRTIYSWVQKNIRYIAFENGIEGFRPRQSAEVLSKRYGDCKDMASIITHMLRIAGIPSYYTWIGTREIPYSYKEVPLPIVDNHMISTAFINDRWYFLDATNSFATLELPPSAIQGKEALVAIDGDNYKLVVVPEEKPEVNYIEDSTIISITEDGVFGHEKVYYHGYFGQGVFNDIHNRNESERESYVKSRMGKASNKFILGRFNVQSDPFTAPHAFINADFSIPGYGKKIGSEYFINLNMEKLMEYQVIDKQKRKVPLEHEFKYRIRQHHILNVPENYTVSHVPEDFLAENKFLLISIKYKVEPRRIIATQEVINKQLLVLPSEFDEWNAPVKAVLPHYKESIVLKLNKQ